MSRKPGGTEEGQTKYYAGEVERAVSRVNLVKWRENKLSIRRTLGRTLQDEPQDRVIRLGFATANASLVTRNWTWIETNSGG